MHFTLDLISMSIVVYLSEFFLSSMVESFLSVLILAVIHHLHDLDTQVVNDWLAGKL